MANSYDIVSQSNTGVASQSASEAAISGDGNLVTFVAFDPVTSQYQVYVKNLSTSALTLVSASSSGIASNATDYYPVISADGSTVGFDSLATNLVASATTGNDEVYVKTLATNGLTLVSQTAAGVVADGVSEYAALSANGNLVAFDSNATNLGLGATGAVREIYLKNVATGALTLVSQTASGTIGNGESYAEGISADGNVVTFSSYSTDLGSASGVDEVYAKNAATGALSIVSQAADGTIANNYAYHGSVSGDGTLVAFESTATNLAAGVSAGNDEIYLKNLQTGALTLVSTAANGTIADGSSYNPVISTDGHYVIFQSTATNLVPGVTGGTQQVYVKNLQTGAVALLSKDATGAPGNNSSSVGYPTEQAFSADDTRTVFTTTATNLDGTPSGSSVLRDTTTGPSLTLGSVTSDNIVSASEIGAPVTLSGTSNAVGGTVQVSIDTLANVIGTATVQADGSWSLTSSLGPLSQGTHTEIATAQGSDYLTTTANQAFTVNTTGPTVAFDQGVAFGPNRRATLTGTVSDPFSAVTNVEIFDNGSDFGAATLNGDGTWTLKHQLPVGPQNLTAVATDALGNNSQPTQPLFSLETGLRGLPYTVDEEDFDSSGNLVAEQFTQRNGSVYLTNAVINFADGSHQIDGTSGTYFDDKDFYYQSDLYSADYSVQRTETLYNNDGTHTISGLADGQRLLSIQDDTMTGNGRNETFVFRRGFGQDTVTDFIAAGPGHDRLTFQSSTFSSVAQVLNRTSDVDGNAVIHVGRNESVTLLGVTKDSLAAHPGDIHLA